MPVIDFHDDEQYDAAIEFLVRGGLAFHTRPPLRLVLSSVVRASLEDAKILPTSEAKTPHPRAKKTRSTAKPKTGRAN